MGMEYLIKDVKINLVTISPITALASIRDNQWLIRGLPTVISVKSCGLWKEYWNIAIERGEKYQERGSTLEVGVMATMEDRYLTPQVDVCWAASSPLE